MPLRLRICGRRIGAVEVEGAAGEGLGDGDGEGPAGEALGDGDKDCPAGEGLDDALKSSCIGDTEVGVAQGVDGPASGCIDNSSEGEAGDKDAGVAQSPDHAGDEGDDVVGGEEQAAEATTGEARAA
jgi:hypothetical protein